MSARPAERDEASPILRRYYELRQYIGLDLLDLDRTFMTTPQVLQDIGELAAKAVNIENVAKHVLDIAKAEAAERIREASRAISETKLATMIALDVEVQDARNAVDKAHFEVQVVAGLYKALTEQSRLLGKAVDMIISGFVTPSALHSQRRSEIRAARVAAEGGGSTTRGKVVLVRPS